MRSGMEILQELADAEGIPLTEDDGAITMRTFMRLDVPMVVRCTGCDMTLVVTNALVDDDGYTWCQSCGKED